MPHAARALPRYTAPLSPDAAMRWAFPAAIALHLALLALLSLTWSDTPKREDNPPMEVDLIAEVAPKSTAPVISAAPPAPKLGEVEELTPPTPAPPAPPPPVKAAPPPPPKAVVPRPTPVKAPASEATPAKAAPVRTPPVKAIPTKAPPTKAAPTRNPPTKAPPTKAPPIKALAPTGRLDGITDGMTRAPPTKAPPAKAAPAAVTAAEVRKSIDVAIDGKIARFWQRNVPSGIDIDQLRVVLQIQLDRDGSILDIRQIGELSGKTDSNRPQQALFIERAIRSVRQAAPFALPAEYYDQWRVWDVTFRTKGIS